jgi:hypothetical protein
VLDIQIGPPGFALVQCRSSGPLSRRSPIQHLLDERNESVSWTSPSFGDDLPDNIFHVFKTQALHRAIRDKRKSFIAEKSDDLLAPAGS